MIKPFRAQYGEYDNSHALLTWDKANGELPTSLLGLTDKPQFPTSPGEVWWPSVGCSPIEEWWALWWTTPDEKAKRSGMAKSEVAIWRIKDIGSIDDLSPFLEELCGIEQILSPPNSLLSNTAEALLSRSQKQPVIKDLDLWPGLLAALWKQLWPSAREHFSVCVAGQPPQGGEWQANPILFGTPPTRAQHWSHYPIFDGNTALGKIGRGALWLSGATDDTIDEIIHASPETGPALININKFARAAAHLDNFRDNNTPDSALSFLRTIATLAPQISQANQLKQEALEVVHDHIQNASAKFINALANLDSNQIPANKFLENEISTWIGTRLIAKEASDAVQLLSFLEPDTQQTWWQKSIQSALTKKLTKLSPKWATATLQWVALGASIEIIQSLLSSSSSNEDQLLAVADGSQLPNSSFPIIREFCKRLGWSRLHAWAAGKESSPAVAFTIQRAFPTSAMDGLVYLLNSLPGKAVLTEYLSHPESTPVASVAQRTVNDSSLIDSLDPAVDSWRRLWAEHIQHGGATWPDRVDTDTAKTDLLNAILEGGTSYGLAKTLAEDLSENALAFPQLDKVLSILPMDEQTALAKQVAQVLITKVNAGHTLSLPSPYVLKEVFKELILAPPSAQFIASLFQWDANIEEEAVRKWLTKLSGDEIATISHILGSHIQALSWKKIAQDIYKRSLHERSLKKLANSCSDLLPILSQLRLKFSKTPSSSIDPADKKQLLLEIARLGADTVTDGLHDLWERAGGKRKHLELYGTPESQWQHAVFRAEDGKLKGGVGALLEALEKEIPHNQELKELKDMWQLLNRKRRLF
ncbi:hypothetical protein GO013_00040 [Pseudodesulfovibrio sp. JC047]|uniref:GAP1-N1 domain-containing protein n=1 Tax=Pseudodesulfovibrio sp. JC047 TaxID=2683199 RepID=UPI0013D43ADA|nr:hypothetical protein [Pseudodesulfovibrio sp. JC047]